MNLTAVLLRDEALATFVRVFAPLANGPFAAATDAERHRVVAELLRVVDPRRDCEPGKTLEDALTRSGESLLQGVKFAMYFAPSSFVWQHRQGEPWRWRCGAFDVHAFLTTRATGCPWLVPRPDDPRSVEFQSSHFHRFSWLSASELAAVRLLAPLESWREEARSAGDAPAWPSGRVEGYLDQCIGQCQELLAVASEGARAGLGLVTAVDNSDWELE